MPEDDQVRSKHLIDMIFNVILKRDCEHFLVALKTEVNESVSVVLSLIKMLHIYV